MPNGMAVERVIKIVAGAIAEPVFDLEVAGTHNMILNGVVTHNCVFAQISPLGQLQIFDGWEMENMGLRQFVEQVVRPVLMTPKYAGITSWRDIGDPSGYNREQSDATQSAAGVLNTLLKTTLEPAPKDWTSRRESLRMLFERMVGKGEPMCLISPQVTSLRKGLRGAWHYIEQHDGQISDLPRKSRTSHICDALGYLAAVLLPNAETLVPTLQPKIALMLPWELQSDPVATHSWMTA